MLPSRSLVGGFFFCFSSSPYRSSCFASFFSRRVFMTTRTARTTGSTAATATTIPDTMRCIVYGKNGKLTSCVTRPVPTKIRQNEVLIRVYAVGINPVDAKQVLGDKLGENSFIKEHILPKYIQNKIPGFDFAGLVVDADNAGDDSSDSNSHFAINDKVFGTVPPFHGTLAEYVVAPIDQISHMPSNFNFVQAAALPLVGLTALQCLSPHIVKEQSSCLILGASGGTGHVAVQVAKKCLGAKHVVAVCSSRNKSWVLASLGADEVVEYDNVDVLEALRASSFRPFDIVMDCVTSADARDREHDYPQKLQNDDAAELLTPNYVYRRLGAGCTTDWFRAGLERTMGISWWKDKHEKLFWIRFPNSSDELRQLGEWAEDGKLTPTIAKVYDFTDESEVQKAFDTILSRRVVGKVVVRVVNEEDVDDNNKNATK